MNVDSKIKNPKNNKNNSPNTENDENSINKRSGLIKKLKYGSVAMAFTIVFIAVVVIVNLVTTSIHVSNPMIIDMTEKQIYGISDATRELIGDITTPVEIIFCMPLDWYEKQRGMGGSMIVNIAKEYVNEFPNISIRIIDLIKNPRAKNEFTASEASTLQTTSVVVKSGSTSRILSEASFFTIAESTGSAMGFRGELQITSAILQVTATDFPIVYFTTGHSETFPPALLQIFKDSGFDVQPIDLTKEDIDPEAKIVVICNPQKDFIGASSAMEKSEIDKVASFLNNFGNVMYFTSPVVGELPEIEDLLKEYGIAFMHDTYVQDEKNAIDVYGLALDSQYVVSENVGDQLTDSIRKLPSLPKTIVHGAKPIVMLDLGTVSENAVSPVLRTRNTAYVMSSEDKAVAQGEIDLLVVSQKTRYIDNNPKTSLLLACGSVNFLADEYLANPSYSNSDIILNAIRIMANRRVPTDLKFKEFDNNELIMTLDEQNNWTLMTILVLPSIVLILGVAVWLRRRHS